MTDHATVAEAGERTLIERIAARLPPAPPWVVVGIGDDAAAVQPERSTLDVLTTDVLVEGVHFERRFMPPDAIGHKALAVSLSDLAAMGATPRAALLSLVLPPDMRVADLDSLVEGLAALARRARAAVVGGNISRSPGPLMVEVTCVGSVRPRRMLTRAGARPGDRLVVSGSIGAAAAGLQSCLARHRGSNNVPDAAARACEGRFLRPEPRVRLGALLGRARVATACIDLSDGLADGLRQLADSSGVGLEVEADCLPIDQDAARWFSAQGQDAIDEACAGGEDYELLFTVPARRLRALAAVASQAGGVLCTEIGVVTADRTVLWRRGAKPSTLPEGFTHFR